MRRLKKKERRKTNAMGQWRTYISTFTVTHILYCLEAVVVEWHAPAEKKSLRVGASDCWALDALLLQAHPPLVNGMAWTAPL